MMHSYITRLLKYGAIASTYLLVGSVLLQIFARFFLPSTPAWTEEASRLFFIYGISFAAGLALKDNYYVYLEFFFDRLPARMRRALTILIPLLTLLLFVCITLYAVDFVILGYQEKSPSMKFSMSYVFFSMIILSASMGYFAFRDLRKSMKEARP